MSLDLPTLQEFVRHAERYGSDCIYETARDYPNPRELGALSVALKRIDRRWRLSPAERTRLALALDAERLPPAQICEMAQISRRTLNRLRAEAAQTAAAAKSGPQTAQPCGKSVPDGATASIDTGRAQMAQPAPQKAHRRPVRAAPDPVSGGRR